VPTFGRQTQVLPQILFLWGLRPFYEALWRIRIDRASPEPGLVLAAESWGRFYGVHTAAVRSPYARMPPSR